MGPQFIPSELSKGEQIKNKLRHTDNPASFKILDINFSLVQIGENGSMEFVNALSTLFCPVYTSLALKIWPRQGFVQKAFSES